MDMQKPGPRGRSSSINPGPGAAVECKTPGVARGDFGAWNWLMHEINQNFKTKFYGIGSNQNRKGKIDEISFYFRQ